MSDVAVEHGPAKRARLYNDGDKLFDYEIQGQQLRIEPGKYIEVARRTAVEAKGTYLGHGREVSLRWEPIDNGEYEEQAPMTAHAKMYACHKCDYETPDKEDMQNHLLSHKKGPKPKG